jgi:phosphoribosylformylglycinamidine synthase subunit PurL
MTPPAEDEEPLHRALGLTDDEFAAVGVILGRAPNHLELALYAVMWSEHCSYKSSRTHLKRLPTEGPNVLVGPGENAGVIDAGDGIAIAIRIESHNHPSAIEPYQGAATGVGGILRDIFTMGARPLAIMDPLFFGLPDDARQRWLVEGVVSGISGYGNSVGVPTVGGELTFDPCYAQNPLVNVLCMGALPVDRLVLGIASGPGNLAVLLGSSTGRDGIGGVSVLASAGFSGDGGTGGGAGGGGADDSKRPSVQVGDPFEEKRLIEACLELLDTKLVVGIQDLGGAGLACATSETAGRGGVGMDVDVTAVPRREEGMEPWEVMTSESQERMLAIVTPESWPAVKAICDKWEVRAAVIGKVTEPDEDPGGNGNGDGHHGGRLRIRDGFDGPILADVPAASLSDDAPLYDRPRQAPVRAAAAPPAPPNTDECADDLLALLRSPRWVFSQYDHQLFLNTVVGPGADAALLRLAGPGLPPSQRGVAVTTDSNPRACALDPKLGTQLALAEGVANLACVGATAVAVVNCLNFGNPEHPEVMWQLSECIDGMADGCTGLGLPIIGGNVSFYNESGGADIDPTPVLGLLGLVDAVHAVPPGLGWAEGDSVVLLGQRTSAAGGFPLEGTRWATERRAHRTGTPPAVDLDAHQAACAFVAGLVSAQVAGGVGLLGSVHDVSSGGLVVALAEMAAAAGVGCVLDLADGAELFTELPSRFVVSTGQPEELCARAAAAGVPAVVLGRAGGERFALGQLVDLPVHALSEAHDGNLASMLGER